MDIEFRTMLQSRLGDSRIEIQNLVGTPVPEGDPQREANRQKFEAHTERAKCIERLLKIEDQLDEIG